MRSSAMVSTAFKALLVGDCGAMATDLETGERDILRRLTRQIELRNNGSGLYSLRMGRFAALIARNLGLPNEQVQMLELAAPLHDMGKIGIPDAILLKRGKLSAQETTVMRRHPQIGHKILHGSGNRFVQLAAIIALRHHERWDGSGYPDGLSGQDIPRAARIVALADVFDALISERPYKDAWSYDAAIDYVRSCRGSLFDPTCVDALLADTARLLIVGRSETTESGQRPHLAVVPPTTT
jgi:two-component system, response regulator RpfG